ncbi:hypothetical protein [Mycobacterium phage WXIN]|nr:hypothetical protein [Mycobacterium phage WXIN]
MRNWWLGLPWPLWTLSACKPFAPWCFVDDVLHWAFPMAFGFWDENVSHFPSERPWCCRQHDRVTERWTRRKYPEYFE